MALRITEFFGFTPLDSAAVPYVAQRQCPFVNNICIKPKHGACSVEQSAGEPIIACPNRLYVQHSVLTDIAIQAFGAGVALTSAKELARLAAATSLTGNEVAVFGKYWGSELSIPKPRGDDVDDIGGFYIDYVLAHIDKTGAVSEFTAVEIQTIDTTGSYREQSEALFQRTQFTDARGNTPGWSKSGLNWANVSKRILPQLIYKGYVLRRERLCSKGLFFVCPSAVLSKVCGRLGTKMLDYPIAAGTITFQAYDLGPSKANAHRDLIKGKTFTTTVEQVAYAFVSPVNLPEMGVYEKAINAALIRRQRKTPNLG
jgi:hypothetical protein